MRPFRTLSLLRREPALGQRIPYTAQVSEHVVRTRAGHYVQVLQLSRKLRMRGSIRAQRLACAVERSLPQHREPQSRDLDTSNPAPGAQLPERTIYQPLRGRALSVFRASLRPAAREANGRFHLRTMDFGSPIARCGSVAASALQQRQDGPTSLQATV